MLNIPTEERSNEANIFLPVLARASAYKKHGMARLLCGVDKGGVQREEPNFAADMRALDAGVSIQIPDDVHGGVKWVRLRAWIMLASCDFLAKKSILPFSEGSAANCFCGDCDYDTRSQAAKRPLSFLRHRVRIQAKDVAGAEVNHLQDGEGLQDSCQEDQARPWPQQVDLPLPSRLLPSY